MAAVYSNGLVLDLAVSLRADVAVFSIEASGRFKLNTTGGTRDGVDPASTSRSPGTSRS